MASTVFIGELKVKLENELGFPFHFDQPDPSEIEPLGVVGSHNTNNNRTAKVGRLIEDLSLQIDIYLPIKYNKLQVNDVRAKAVKIIGRRSVSTSVSEDNSTNRNLWRINILINQII
jgi:hypothetical protein